MGPGIPTLRSEVSSLLSAARPADLLSTIQHLEACRVDLYLDQQNIDTTTPMGRLVYQVTGAFAEFERSLIKQRVRAGLDRARAQGKRLGRPRTDLETERAIRAALAAGGKGLLKIAADFVLARARSNELRPR